MGAVLSGAARPAVSHSEWPAAGESGGKIRSGGYIMAGPPVV